MFLMPSRYEPSGLNQLYSLRYGTVPIVRAVGGLADTITDYTPETVAAGTATGFQFGPFSAQAFLVAVKRALHTWRHEPVIWRQLVQTGMQQDWSWNRSAADYERIYAAADLVNCVPTTAKRSDRRSLGADRAERARRPFQLGERANTGPVTWCPFCEGEESRTPPEVFALRQPDTKADGSGLERPASCRTSSRLPDAMHRPVTRANCSRPRLATGCTRSSSSRRSIETRSPTCPSRKCAAIFDVFRRRLAVLSADPRLRYVQIFKNHGAGAGASVEHVHSQILGVPLVPREIAAGTRERRSYTANRPVGASIAILSSANLPTEQE